MQLLNWFSLMKEIVMCSNKLKLKSSLKANRPSKLFKHCNFAFAFFGEGGDSYLKSDFRRVG